MYSICLKILRWWDLMYQGMFINCLINFLKRHNQSSIYLIFLLHFILNLQFLHLTFNASNLVWGLMSSEMCSVYILWAQRKFCLSEIAVRECASCPLMKFFNFVMQLSPLHNMEKGSYDLSCAYFSRLFIKIDMFKNIHYY